ncbi:MAG TPA: DNA-formamidopyrimidine glycosylase [Anaerolineales bacterium]|nr:DNA-formamidopyrimidine glycosylase [Anaerolineales bacterium]
MPELPEVETRVREMRPLCVGRTIVGVRLQWARHVEPLLPSEFEQQILGQEILAVERRAKYLVFRLSRQDLLIHLRMSGDLSVVASGTPYEKHDHTTLGFDNHTELRFNDARKFGRATLVASAEQFTAHLGPEPLDPAFTAVVLYQRLQNSNRALKPLLLDQTFLAGVGNIYCDEALFASGLHPLRLASSLSEQEVALLWQNIRQVLWDGIARNGASIDWVYRGGSQQHHFAVYGRTHQPCLTCGTPIQRLVVGQRGTHICPQCQPSG